MAPKRALPEQSMQPPRKCRRVVNYAEQQNESDNESSSQHDSDNELASDDKDSVTDHEDKSDHGYGSESEASNKGNSSEAEYQPAHEHKGARPPTKRIARTVTQPTTPAKRILRASSKAPSAIRKDSGIYDSTSSETTPSRPRPRAKPTLAEQKPWVPWSQLLSYPIKGHPEIRPWVPVYPIMPATAENQYENDAEDAGGEDGAGGAGGAGGNESDDDSDSDFNDDDEDETATGGSLDPYSTPRKSQFSFMDYRNPYSPANFRSCMEALPVEESSDASSDEDEKEVQSTYRGGKKAIRGENSDAESASSEYTGEDEATDEHDQEDM